MGSFCSLTGGGDEWVALLHAAQQLLGRQLMSVKIKLEGAW